jgi:predicted ATPase
MTAIVDQLIDLAAGTPTTLVLEDLHWADSSSLQLLSLVTASLPSSGLGVVATSRPGFPHVDAVLGSIRRFPASHEIRLDPLSEDEVRAYLAASGGSTSASAPSCSPC